jgi:outer membrane protein assembly factor BamD
MTWLTQFFCAARLFWALGFVGVTLAVGCGTTDASKKVVRTGPRDEAKELAAEANTSLVKGEKALKDKDYLDAERLFEYVKSKYPFSEAAREAELRLADTDFDRDRLPEARDRYQNFVKLHPTHPKVDYAAFRMALTHYKEMPGDFFLVPSSTEKDQTDIRGAYKAINEFVRQYPDSKMFPEAKKMLDDTRSRLAEHELYVAGFYAKREKWAAVASRLENVVEKYPGGGQDEKALFQLHNVYLKLKNPERAQEALRRIISRFPGSSAAARAQVLLGS